jgi:hypothetical protein
MIFEQKTSYSKSQFFLIKKDNKFLIVKKPKKLDKRELLSIKKQNNFQSYFIENYKVTSAKILGNEKDIKNKKTYLIEYFDGKSGEDILLQGNKEEINILKKFFYNYFFKVKNNIHLELRDLKEYKEKIKNLKKNKNFKLIKNSKKILLFVDNILKKKIYTFSLKKCHGDLTLSNLIVNFKKKEIILIDFLSTYEENLIQDFSKLFQEFNLHWTARKYDKIDYLRSSIVYESIINYNFWKKIDSKLTNSLKLEFIMTILRIIPYVDKNDEKTINWIENSLDKIKQFKKQ